MIIKKCLVCNEEYKIKPYEEIVLIGEAAGRRTRKDIF